MFTKFKVWLCKTFYSAGLLWWRLWSIFYSKLWELKNGHYELPMKLSVEQILGQFKLLTWTPDGAKELWDVCAGPEWVQKALLDIKEGKPQPKGGLDCDDFAVWAANTALLDYYPHIFIITWLSKDNEIKGHVMCLLHFTNGTNCFVSNWGASEPFALISDGCEQIMKDVEAKQMIGCAVLDKKLFLLEYNTREFPKRGFI